jgi:octaprenyl-diphosphate synthase
VIHALEQGTGAEREAIHCVLADRSFERTSHAEIVAILARHRSIEYARSTAMVYAETAKTSLGFLPESDFKRGLLWIPEFRGAAGELARPYLRMPFDNLRLYLVAN